MRALTDVDIRRIAKAILRVGSEFGGENITSSASASPINQILHAIQKVGDALTDEIASVNTALQSADIDTLEKLNAIITNATLDNNISNRPPASHSHALQAITDAGTLASEDDAPSDGSQYARKDAGWEVVSGGGDLSEADIDTLAELNAIVTDATLIDTGDSRLSDARTPTAHTHTESEITDLGTYLEAGDIDTLAEINAVITDATLIDTGDSRLSDARTPTAHTHTESDITDLGSYSVTGHTHTESEITDLGTYLEASDIDTLAEVNAIITDATLIDTGDSRLSDARTPTAHTHTESEITDLGSYSTTGHTHTESEITDLGSYADATHNHAATEITSGTLPDARVASSNVTQHQAALSITESQISDLQAYLKSADINTLAELNAIVADATLDDSSATRTPSAHNHAASEITSGTLADARISSSSVVQHEGDFTAAGMRVKGSGVGKLIFQFADSSDATLAYPSGVGTIQLLAAQVAETLTGQWMFAAGLKTDDISERTSAHGVEIDGVTCKDSVVYGGIPTYRCRSDGSGQDINASSTEYVKWETSIAHEIGDSGVSIDGTTTSKIVFQNACDVILHAHISYDSTGTYVPYFEIRKNGSTMANGKWQGSHTTSATGQDLGGASIMYSGTVSASDYWEIRARRHGTYTGAVNVGRSEGTLIVQTFDV